MKLAIILTATMCLTATGSLAADPLFQKAFPKIGDCYARTYDKAHLRKHPQQRVTSIWFSRKSSDGMANPPDMLFGFGFQINQKTYSSDAICQRKNQCRLEGDSGDFTVKQDGKNLRLTVGNQLVIEGDDFSPDLAKSKDDRVFIVQPAPTAACRS